MPLKPGLPRGVAGQVRSTAVIASLAIAMASSAEAQLVGRYQPTTDTLRYGSLNSYFLYFVRGRDTLGTPATVRSTETRSGIAKPGGIEFLVRIKGDEGTNFDISQIFLVNQSGRVLQVGGHPVSQEPSARVDLFPRWPTPPAPLTEGLTWIDTVSTSGAQAYGSTFYQAERHYRLIRLIDSLDTRIAHVVASGTVRLRQGGWADQARQQAWWQEVSGPVIDTVWFDASRGRVLASVAIIDLTGTGGSSGGPVMTSGLRSSVRLVRQ